MSRWPNRKNKYLIEGDIAYIFLENRHGEVIDKAIIDKEDLKAVLPYKWHKHVATRNTTYVEANKIGQMHTFLLGKVKGKVIDHINGNGLDNRRSNLEHVSPSANGRNVTHHKKNVGVYYQSSTGRYEASICHQYHIKHLGTYDTIEEAQEARNKAEAALRYL